MESEEPVLFSEFGLKGSKDRHLRYVMRRLGGNPRPGFFNYDTTWLANFWLADLHDRWNSLRPEFKSRLVEDLLDELYRREGCFDALFRVFFDHPREPDTDYSATVCDILRSFGQEHTFPKDGHLLNILDFPLERSYPGFCDADLNEIPCVLGDLCRNICQPLYVAYWFGGPDLVRVLLNSGASLQPDAVCVHEQYSFHPLTVVAGTASALGDLSKAYSCLRLVLVDSTARLREDFRKHNWLLLAVDEIPSLQHLARACIRRKLREARCIGRTGALLRCGLPRSLQSYVYMEDVVVDV